MQELPGVTQLQAVKDSYVPVIKFQVHMSVLFSSCSGRHASVWLLLGLLPGLGASKLLVHASTL